MSFSHLISSAFEIGKWATTRKEFDNIKFDEF